MVVPVFLFNNPILLIMNSLLELELNPQTGWVHKPLNSIFRASPKWRWIVEKLFGHGKLVM